MIVMVMFVELINYDQRSLLQPIKGFFYYCDQSTLWNILVNCIFLLKIMGVRVKIGGSRPGNNKYFSYRHIFQTYMHMYKTIYASIQYYLSPFQWCITLKFQYMETYWKYCSKYVEGGQSPLI